MPRPKTHHAARSDQKLTIAQHTNACRLILAVEGPDAVREYCTAEGVDFRTIQKQVDEE